MSIDLSLHEVPRASPPGASAPLRTAVVIATAGRPDVVGDVLEDVRRQSLPPEWVVLSVPDEQSLPSSGVPEGVIVVNASGAAAQRNAGLAAVPDADVAVFFDDDARVRDDYLERAVEVLQREPTVIALTGRVLLDGASGPEVGVGEALAALDGSRAEAEQVPLRERKTLYGCNFAFRVGATAQRFDARLPLYSWLEDHDLARRLLREGRLVTAPACVIVHRGVKSGGRTSHRRLGYSQVMNPAYFVRKGSFPVGLALDEIGRRVAKNLLLSLRGQECAWRRERLQGNLHAAWDLLRWRFTPERILQL